MTARVTCRNIEFINLQLLLLCDVECPWNILSPSLESGQCVTSFELLDVLEFYFRIYCNPVCRDCLFFLVKIKLQCIISYILPPAISLDTCTRRGYQLPDCISVYAQ